MHRTDPAGPHATDSTGNLVARTRCGEDRLRRRLAPTSFFETPLDSALVLSEPSGILCIHLKRPFGQYSFVLENNEIPGRSDVSGYLGARRDTERA